MPIWPPLKRRRFLYDFISTLSFSFPKVITDSFSKRCGVLGGNLSPFKRVPFAEPRSMIYISSPLNLMDACSLDTPASNPLYGVRSISGTMGWPVPARPRVTSSSSATEMSSPVWRTCRVMRLVCSEFVIVDFGWTSLAVCERIGLEEFCLPGSVVGAGLWGTLFELWLNGWSLAGFFTDPGEG